MQRPWYQIDDAEQVDSPALLIHPDRVRENIRRIIAYAGGVDRLRPHVKTHKMAEVVRLQMDAGITRFKCATLAEAEMVAGCGAPDVLIAYQLTGPKAPRFARLLAAFPKARFSTIVDDAGAARGLSHALTEAGLRADVLIDIDAGLGRTGIAPGPAAVELYRLIAGLSGLTPAGLHVYDGHVRDPDFSKRTQDCDAAFAPIEELRRQLEQAGLGRPRVVAGGTPTFRIHSRHADRECSPGTSLFWDAGYAAKLPDLEFLHAAVLLTRVISKPRPDRLCLDLGYKSVASDNPDPRAAFLDIPDAKMLVHNEEHMAIETARAGDYAVGDAIYAIPWHICPTCALYPAVWVVENGRTQGQWKVAARDRALTI